MNPIDAIIYFFGFVGATVFFIEYKLNKDIEHTFIGEITKVRRKDFGLLITVANEKSANQFYLRQEIFDHKKPELILGIRLMIKYKQGPFGRYLARHKTITYIQKL